MKWRKKGFIYAPDGKYEWNKSHASVPTMYKVNNNKLRIYFATRDSRNRTNITFIEVDADNPQNILYTHDKAIITPGKAGMFDDCGAMPSHVIDVGNEVWMYYLGWNVRNTIAYHNAIGLAISKDNGVTFEKFSEGPLFDRTYKEPYYSAVAYILREDELWRMWYLSNTDWVEYDGKE